MASLTAQDYQVGWICALPEELTAAMAMLDKEHEMIAQRDTQDRNSYVLGRIHQHNVVIAGMPAGVDGLVSATVVARDMVRTFPALRIGLMVGIGGGIPNLIKGIDVRLGDIVVSTPQKTWGGVVQYDKGKAEQGGQFVVKGQLNQPPTLLLNAVTQIQARHMMRPSKVTAYIDEAIKRDSMLEENGFGLPEKADRFCCSLCDCKPDTPTTECTGVYTERKLRKNKNPLIQYGVIASGNQVVKDAVVRDRLRKDFGAICVEMEAAGLMNNFPCLVVRGICDYADVHKNDVWHPYAAMTAAAYAKELLQYITPAQTNHVQPIREVLGLLDDIHRTSKAQLEAAHAHIQQGRIQYESEKHSRCHQTFKVGPYEEQKNNNPERVEGTCQWVLSHVLYQKWTTSHTDDLLWISADPGCGKSVLARSLVDQELASTTNHSVCYFFFKDNDEQDNLATALCALLHQLFSQQPRLLQYALPAWEKAGSQLIQDVSELWRTLLSAAQDRQTHDVTFVLDAMDECRPADRRSLIEKLSRFYSQVSSSLPKSRPGRLRFLVTSRPYDDIQAEFQKTLNNLPTIRLRGEDENDRIHEEIDLVIRMRVNKLATDLPLDEQTKGRLLNKLLQMEHRTYLWLYLAIDDIAKTYRHSLRPQEALIKSLPATVEDAYEKILARVSEEQRVDVKTILQIVVGARRPLTIHEIAIALGMATATQPQSQSLQQMTLDSVWLERHIRQWCGLFVFINHARIYLIHQTAKEFLVARNHIMALSSGWKHSLDRFVVEREMVQICTSFIGLKEIRSVAEQLRSKFERYTRVDEVVDKDNYAESFFGYAAEHWPDHLREAELATDNAMNEDLCSLYDVSSGLYDVWFPTFWQTMFYYQDQPQMNPIRLAALLGHQSMLYIIWQRYSYTYDINACDEDGRNALYWACNNGHTKSVQILLERGADVNAQGGHYGTALQAASWGGHEKIVQILLERGADVSAQGGDFGTALQAASVRGHEKIVQMLLDIGADVNAQGGHYGGVLQAASVRGHEKTVQMLLDSGADVNAQGGRYGGALQAASWGGHEKIVQILLERGADVSAQGGRFGNTLQAASRAGHEKIMQMLSKYEASSK